MTNRRQFLERSMLGFGSAFLLPSLLTSCSDHIIPDPGEITIIPTPSTGIQLPWNDIAKAAVVNGLELIPEAGEILGPLADLFWPKSKEDVWGEVKAQTEELVNKKISDQVYATVKTTLGEVNNYNMANGLLGQIILYMNEVKNGTPAQILTQWTIAQSQFVQHLGDFQQPGYEVPLLGLFGQFANLYLALLRDGVLFGKSWGRTEKDHQDDITYLKTVISGFTNYTTLWYKSQRVLVEASAPTDPLKVEPFRTVNAFDRQMAFLVLDFRDTWQYYDASLYPNGAPVVISREIYSDPMGSIAESDNPNLVIPLPPPTQRPTQLSFWGGSEGTYGNHLAAAQVTYPAGSGPGGVTTTPRMGAQSFGTNGRPVGGTFTLSPNNPVVGVECTYTQYYINDIILTFNDGNKTYPIGDGTGDPNAKTTTIWAFPNEFMSSILITGASYQMAGKAAACLVIGFQSWQPPSATLSALGSIYVTSPKEHSAADLAKAFPKLGLSANSINEALKAARKAHWEYIEAIAKALK